MKHIKLEVKNRNIIPLSNKNGNTSMIPDALKNFDSLPDSANVRQAVVQGLFGCSAATVWRMVKRGTLPAPRKITPHISAWNVAELRKSLSTYEL
ncbi:AlpA family transcriptional regulator [Sulfuriferula sp. AH1]|uniref:helix-turn-helix transcriptional regulator n=1 Tax=Sulfuriferula sp. AH1 TaxID=1985873 RepID=UPI001CB96FF8|nr:transcriptional regulator [Sulfuriferula sp. AH1]